VIARALVDASAAVSATAVIRLFILVLLLSKLRIGISPAR